MTDDGYIIRYSHTGPTYTDTLAEAREKVRDEAMRVCGSAAARAKVVFIKCEEGTYAYITQQAADADASDGGDRSLAVIARRNEEP